MVWMRTYRNAGSLLYRRRDGDEKTLPAYRGLHAAVDADQDVEFADAEVADDFRSFDGSDIGMEVADADAHFLQIVRQSSAIFLVRS